MDNIFIKSNRLIKQPNLYKAIEQKCINKIINFVYNNDNSLVYEAESRFFIPCLKGTNLTQAKIFNVFEAISKPMHIIKPTDEEFELLSPITCPKLNKQTKIITFQVPQDYKKNLFVKNHDENNNLLRKCGYTELNMNSVLSLPSKYSIKGYEILKSLSFANNKIEININELIRNLGIKEGYYSSYMRFNAEILKVIFNQINEFCVDFKIKSYEAIKKAGKVSSIEFICQRLTGKEIEIPKPTPQIEIREATPAEMKLFDKPKQIQATEFKPLETILETAKIQGLQPKMEESALESVPLPKAIPMPNTKALPDKVQELLNHGYSSKQTGVLLNMWATDSGKQKIVATCYEIATKYANAKNKGGLIYKLLHDKNFGIKKGDDSAEHWHRENLKYVNDVSKQQQEENAVPQYKYFADEPVEKKPLEKILSCKKIDEENKNNFADFMNLSEYNKIETIRQIHRDQPLPIFLEIIETKCIYAFKALENHKAFLCGLKLLKHSRQQVA